jgi:hypothetical protein
MKKCSYCGAEYPDDAIVCAIDQTPFEDVQLVAEETAAPLKLPKFAIFSEQKIPVSLGIVSYFFFIPGAMVIAAVVFVVSMLSFSGGMVGNEILLPSIISAAVGILTVSCFLMFPVMIVVAYIIFAIFLAVYSFGGVRNQEVLLPELIGGAFGIASIYLSRGLRNCSRRWRTCALVLLWWSFFGTAYGVGRSFLIYVQTYGHKTLTPLTIISWIAVGLYFIFQIWQYRVLTRPDIRELFYNES